jgi:hypothetical protein
MARQDGGRNFYYEVRVFVCHGPRKSRAFQWLICSKTPGDFRIVDWNRSAARGMCAGCEMLLVLRSGSQPRRAYTLPTGRAVRNTLNEGVQAGDWKVRQAARGGCQEA